MNILTISYYCEIPTFYPFVRDKTTEDHKVLYVWWKESSLKYSQFLIPVCELIHKVATLVVKGKHWFSVSFTNK